MTVKDFYTVLTWVTIGTGLTLYGFSSLSKFQIGYFPLIGLLFFLFFSILIFHLGKATAGSADKNKFTSVVMSMIFLKLVLTIFIIIGFDKLISKVQLPHVVCFLISYLFYTIYEVFFMSKLAKINT
jgi:hypothetical protein